MPKPGDRTVKIITVCILCLYVIAFTAGLAMQQLLLYASAMNVVAGTLIISYWVWDKLRPLQRIMEQRELVVLLLESIFIAVSVFAILHTPNGWANIAVYFIFALHAVLVLLFLIFMLTFMIKKLF